MRWHVHPVTPDRPGKNLTLEEERPFQLALGHAFLWQRIRPEGIRARLTLPRGRSSGRLLCIQEAHSAIGREQKRTGDSDRGNAGVVSSKVVSMGGFAAANSQQRRPPESAASEIVEHEGVDIGDGLELLGQVARPVARAAPRS